MFFLAIELNLTLNVILNSEGNRSNSSRVTLRKRTNKSPISICAQAYKRTHILTFQISNVQCFVYCAAVRSTRVVSADSKIQSN